MSTKLLEIRCRMLISTIVALFYFMCCAIALRKECLMIPNSFTALSGDLHVQVQFGNNETQSENSSATAAIHFHGGAGADQHAVHRTLVISKLMMENEDQYVKALKGMRKKSTTTTTSSPSSERSGENSTTSLLHTDNEHADENGDGAERRTIRRIPIVPDRDENLTQIVVPCDTFLKGGIYELQVITETHPTHAVRHTSVVASDYRVNSESGGLQSLAMTKTAPIPAADERSYRLLNVRWPIVDIRVSAVHLRTYPEEPVEVQLRFPEVNCDRALESGDLPEFWLELLYCGKEAMCHQMLPHNISKANIFYAEQIIGYPKLKIVQLKCELFGLAGKYAIQVRSATLLPNEPITRRFLTVDWSDKFVFNVYARSIFPCDTHTGISVLYEYPHCILDQSDRVRVYARLRADVTSLKPPTSLHYIAEQRVVKSQHSLHFSCDLFTEKYVEYCFVYVSQAISGAVANVRMECVPTLPIQDSEAGGWSPWSEWTACSTNCTGGVRTRYRLCNSPPPRYGARFCEGPSVEREYCGRSADCMFEDSFAQRNGSSMDSSSSSMNACRCGCLIQLKPTKAKQTIAGAAENCTGPSFWLIQASASESVSLMMNFVQLPCLAQYIKIRDGPALLSTLLLEINGGGNIKMPVKINSSGAQLLIEFFTASEKFLPGNHTDDIRLDALSTSGCIGGFYADAELAVQDRNVAPSQVPSTKHSTIHKSHEQNHTDLRATVIHVIAASFASLVIIISATLGMHYVYRYRKYYVTLARQRYKESRLHTPKMSMSSLQGPPSRALSTTTLLSDVVGCPARLSPPSVRRETELHCPPRKTFDFSKHTGKLKNAVSAFVLGNDDKSYHGDCMKPYVSFDALMGTRECHIQRNQRIPSSSVNLNMSSTDIELKNSDDITSIYNPIDSDHNTDDLHDIVTLKGSYPSMSMQSGNVYALESNYGGYGGREQGRRGIQLASYTPISNQCPSPELRQYSTRTLKDIKEKQNLKKVLIRPDSEMSVGNQQELELDYYDYNVVNASTVPGSYLGMDPAYLIWVPPIQDYTNDLDLEREHAKSNSNSNSNNNSNSNSCERLKLLEYKRNVSTDVMENRMSSSKCDAVKSPTSPAAANKQSVLELKRDKFRTLDLHKLQFSDDVQFADCDNELDAAIGENKL